MTTIKLAKRKALLDLNTKECRVKTTSGKEYYTLPGIVDRNDIQCVRAETMHGTLYIPLTQISHIEVGNRFNPEIHTMMEVDWND